MLSNIYVSVSTCIFDQRTKAIASVTDMNIHNTHIKTRYAIHKKKKENDDNNNKEKKRRINEDPLFHLLHLS